MNQQERFSELWTDYLEGELDADGILALRDLLAEDSSLVTLAADLYQTHRLLGLVAEEVPERQDAFVREVLSHLPGDSDRFIDGVMSDLEQITNPSRTGSSAGRPQRSVRPIALLAVISLTIVIVVAYNVWQTPQPEITQAHPGPSEEPRAEAGVRFSSLAHARFFGELVPPVDSIVMPGRDHVLMSGLAEIRFPAGASAIIEGPAVFRVVSDECLALDVGRCSVHAPDGAEGFRVDTPVTRVVDRGTRFSVSVAETSETEVQVIEGAADISELAGDSATMPGKTVDEIRLTNGEARMFARGRVFAADRIPFDPGVYRRELPDRIISYETTQATDQRAENLASVTLQRNGRIVTVPVDELIPCRVSAFKATSPGAFLCGSATLPESDLTTLPDRNLVTGVINPGGSSQPLTSDPVLTGDSATPGMAIEFEVPVENAPGADIVFFDLQTFSNPPDGDAFHLSPLQFRDGLKSHTVHVYDLTMESPGARDLTGFYVHMFSEAAGSLQTLQTLPRSPRKQVIRFRGLVVGVDLSDLGYAEGETVDGLFLQDALDDGHFVDPVFIGGLPAAK